MYQHFATAAQRQTANRRHNRHIRVTQFQEGILQIGFHFFNRWHAAHHERGQHSLQIRARREHRIGRPNHQPLVMFFRQSFGLQQSRHHRRIQCVHFGLNAGDENVRFAVERPQANRLVFQHRIARRVRLRRVRTEHRFGKVLPLVNGQIAHRNELPRGRVKRTFRLMHAAAFCDRTFKHPAR